MFRSVLAAAVVAGLGTAVVVTTSHARAEQPPSAVPAGPVAAGAPVPGSIAPPAGFQKVYDDLTMLAVSIPDDWVVADSAPSIGDDGVAYPSLHAVGPGAADVSPGPSELWFHASPREEPLEPIEPECTPEEEQMYDCEPFYGVEPYDDGRYAGYRAWMGAGTTGEDRQIVKVNPEGSPYTISLDFFEGGGDASVFDTMLQTFELTPLAYEPPATSPGAATDPTPAPAPQPSDGLVPVDSYAIDAFWGEFRSVPQLGAEPVRGSGCGANNEIGDVIPDGTWAAFVTWDEGEADAYNVDLLCVYTPEAAPGVVAAGGATIINDDPEYLVVNNNTRTRRVPTTMFVAQFQYRDDGNGTCVIDPGLGGGPGDPTRQAWIEIRNGIAVAVGWDCHPLGGTAATPADNGAPADPANNEEWDGFPFGEFWNVPQLGPAPVRGSGCGSGTDGDVLGDTIPDGWWAGYVSADAATGVLWVDLLCIYYGDSARAVVAEATANIVSPEPDYLIVNNSDRRRAVPNGLAAYTVAVGSMDQGRCEPWPLGVAQRGDGLPTDELLAAAATSQAWIHIDGGRATALAYGCDVDL